MSNYSWVCFACQCAARRPATDKQVRCPSCGQCCQCLGSKIEVPSKAKLKQWELLRKWFYVARSQRLVARDELRVRRIHQLEQELARLQALPENPGRDKAVTELKKKLTAART